MKKIQALFFDMDGTLIDSENHYLSGTYRWMTHKGFNGSMEDLLPIIGRNMPDTYAFLQGFIPFYSLKDIEMFNTEYFTVTDPLRYDKLLFGDVRKTLIYLRENGYKMALCSMDAMHEMKRFVEECALENVFDLLLSGEECSANKPDPEIYLKALQAFHLNGDEALVIEDSASGIAAGKAAGITTLARLDTRFGIDQSKADKTFNSLTELKQYLKENQE